MVKAREDIEVCVQNRVQPALIMIPDISGFTKYMSQADLFHSQVKVASLLTSILASNHLGLTASEIEGDAILFYDFNNKSSLNDVLYQCHLMRDSFHRTLFELQSSECQCGSCSALQSLQLKFVLHYGLLGSVMVKDFCALFGKDLILAHRLLKADIPSKEHLILTEAFFTQYSNGNPGDLFDSANWISGKEVMDGIGPVNFNYRTFDLKLTAEG